MDIIQEVKTLYNGKQVFYLATVDESGTPNVVAMLQYEWTGDNEMVIADVMMKQTAQNVKTTGKVSLCAWNRETNKSYKLKGSATYVTEGPAFDLLLSRRPGLKEKAKGAVLVKLLEIYDASRGSDAGKLLLKL